MDTWDLICTIYYFVCFGYTAITLFKMHELFKKNL